jgi:CheY-like chemotaxis protein
MGVWGVEELPVIMVVEDDQLVQTMVEAALADGGFEPAIAASGEEAVTLLKGGLAWQGRLGSCKAGQRDRPGVSHRLYDRPQRRGIWFEGRFQQHPFEQAVCARATRHRRFPAFK